MQGKDRTIPGGSRDSPASLCPDGCGGGGETAETEAGGAATEAEGGEEAGGEATDETKRIAYVVGSLGDKSFNDSGEAGMKQL